MDVDGCGGSGGVGNIDPVDDADPGTGGIIGRFVFDGSFPPVPSVIGAPVV